MPVLKDFLNLFDSWWAITAFMIIPVGFITAALTALPSVIGILGSLFGKKKKETEYTSGLAPQDQAFRGWIQNQIKGLAGSYKQNVPQIPRSYLDAQALLYKKFGLGKSPAYKPKSYARGGIADYPQTARLAERGPEAIVPLGAYPQARTGNPWRQMGGGWGSPPPSVSEPGARIMDQGLTGFVPRPEDLAQIRDRFRQPGVQAGGGPGQILDKFREPVPFMGGGGITDLGGMPGGLPPQLMSSRPYMGGQPSPFMGGRMGGFQRPPFMGGMMSPLGQRAPYIPPFTPGRSDWY